MGKRSEKPTIRILILGAPGVGKNCLESRFTTMTYPPLYNPNLTINGRRFFTLTPDSPSPPANPIDGSDGSSVLRTSSVPSTSEPCTQRRPHSASSTFSNPASEPRTRDTHNGPAHASGSVPPKLSLQTSELPIRSTPSHTPITPISPLPDVDDGTYLVEVTNYPALQNPKVRAQFLAKGEYDAVLLVYDVGNRASFDAIPALHAEVPIIRKRGGRRKKVGTASPGGVVRRTRSSIFGGDRNSASSPVDDNTALGTGETVVALVGNKSDFDAEYASIDLEYPLMEKEAVMQEAEVEERSLVHPLFRQSRVYEDMPLSPMSTKSARSGPVGGTFEKGSDVRRSRSIASDGSGGQRVSVFSAARRGSLNLVPEDSKEEKVEGEEGPSFAPPSNMLPTPPNELTPALAKWLEVDSQIEMAGENPSRTSQQDNGCTRIGTRDTEATRVAEREVTRFEGDVLARSLMLNVPFLETSAKTGENIEVVFEAIVREVLREMGKDVGPGMQVIGQRARNPLGETQTPREERTPVLGRKRSVLKKERRSDEKADGRSRESIVSDRPPVLTLSGLDEEKDGDKGNDVSVDVAVQEVDVSNSEAPPPLPPKRRRESSLGNFFKKVFTKKPAAMAPEVAV